MGGVESEDVQSSEISEVGFVCLAESFDFHFIKNQVVVLQASYGFVWLTSEGLAPLSISVIYSMRADIVFFCSVEN